MSYEPMSTDSHKEATTPESHQPYHEGLEVSPYDHYQQSQHLTGPSAQTARPEKTIFGLRRTTFLLSVALVLAIAAAVAGGVGGSMAAKNSACTVDSSTVSVTTVTATVASTATGTSTSGLTVPTGVVALDCPSLTGQDQTIELADHSWTFAPTCGTDFVGADITAVIVYSFHDCLQGCAAMNYFAGNTTCAAVTFNANQTYEIPKDYGNCWLKKGTGTVTQGLGDYIVSATLKSSS